MFNGEEIKKNNREDTMVVTAGGRILEWTGRILITPKLIKMVLYTTELSKMKEFLLLNMIAYIHLTYTTNGTILVPK